MQRIKLADRVLPVYTKGEEIFNMTSHIVGAAFGVAVTVLCVIMAASHNNVYGIVGGAIYGLTMILLYTFSSIYHGLNPKRTSKKVFQILDYCSIFLLIADSYTPVALCNIRSIDSVAGWWIFGIIWFAAILGIVLNSIDLKSTKKFSMICYFMFFKDTNYNYKNALSLEINSRCFLYYRQFYTQTKNILIFVPCCRSLLFLID